MSVSLDGQVLLVHRGTVLGSGLLVRFEVGLTAVPLIEEGVAQGAGGVALRPCRPTGDVQNSASLDVLAPPGTGVAVTLRRIVLWPEFDLDRRISVGRCLDNRWSGMQSFVLAVALEEG